jgi:hypothetical protein
MTKPNGPQWIMIGSAIFAMIALAPLWIGGIGLWLEATKAAVSFVQSSWGR